MRLATQTTLYDTRSSIVSWETIVEVSVFGTVASANHCVFQTGLLMHCCGHRTFTDSSVNCLCLSLVSGNSWIQVYFQFTSYFQSSPYVVVDGLSKHASPIILGGKLWITYLICFPCRRCRKKRVSRGQDIKESIPTSHSYMIAGTKPT